MEHPLGQCACGQYHLTTTQGFVTKAHPMASWELPDPDLPVWVEKTYEGKHRSE